MIKLPGENGIEILRCVVGSKLWGTGIPGSQDHDEMGIYIEAPIRVLGLTSSDHWIYRSAPEGQRSSTDDTDITCYSLRKWARLALSGNPTVLSLLFAPKDLLLTCNIHGESLRRMAPEWVASRKAGSAFLGYFTQQRDRMTGERGGAGRIRKTDGEYDMKYAMHMLRLGFQGGEYLLTGKLTLPMPKSITDYLLDVRKGKYTLPEILSAAGDLETDLKLAIHDSPLPAKPNTKFMEEWLVNTHIDQWGYM